jgi:hypothetical protein
LSLFNQWWDAANSKDRSKMAELLDDAFIFARHNTGEEWSKGEFLDYMLAGIRDKTTCENRRLIYENDEIIVSHSILDGPAGRNAVMLVRSVKDGKIVRAETGSTPLSIE